MSGPRVERDGPGRFRLSGDLSFQTVPDVWRQVEQTLDGASCWEVDLSGVSRSDSAGLALLVEWVREGRRRHADVRFHRLPEQMRALAEVSGLEFLPLAEGDPGGGSGDGS